MWNSELSEEDIHEMVNRVQAQIRNDQIIKKGQLMDRPEEGKTMRQQPLKKIAVVKKAQKQMRNAQKGEPDEQFYIQDFMPHQTDKSSKHFGKKYSQFDGEF